MLGRDHHAAVLVVCWLAVCLSLWLACYCPCQLACDLLGAHPLPGAAAYCLQPLPLQYVSLKPGCRCQWRHYLPAAAWDASQTWEVGPANLDLTLCAKHESQIEGWAQKLLQHLLRKLRWMGLQMRTAALSSVCCWRELFQAAVPQENQTSIPEAKDRCQSNCRTLTHNEVCEDTHVSCRHLCTKCSTDMCAVQLVCPTSCMRLHLDDIEGTWLLQKSPVGPASPQ